MVPARSTPQISGNPEKHPKKFWGNQILHNSVKKIWGFLHISPKKIWGFLHNSAKKIWGFLQNALFLHRKYKFGV